MRVTVFSPPRECVACRQTVRAFDRAGVGYEVVVCDEALIDSLRRDGFTEFPVVKVDCGAGASWSWSGFRIDEIKRLAQLSG